jgi:hypothetical protein
MVMSFPFGFFPLPPQLLMYWLYTAAPYQPSPSVGYVIDVVG